LTVNGTLNGNVVMGATSSRGNYQPFLTGAGRINGDVTVLNGTVWPTGITTINGNYTQGLVGGSSNTSLVVNVDPSTNSASQLFITGAATIVGNSTLTISVFPRGSFFLQKTATFPVLSANGGVTGMFGTTNISSNLPFLTPAVAYNPNSVVVTITRDFSSDVVPGHFQAFGDALNQVADQANGAFASALGSVAVVSFDQLEYILNQLSGRGYSAFGTVGVQTAQSFMNTISQQMSGFRSYGGGTGRVAWRKAATRTIRRARAPSAGPPG
jgi:hypothetical protein